MSAAEPRGPADPWPLTTQAPLRLLAWPRWEESGALEALARAVAPAVADGFAALVLRHDPLVDGDADSALERVWSAFAARDAELEEVEVLLVDASTPAGDLRRLGHAVHGLVDVDGRGALDLARAGLVPMRDAAAVRAWREARRGEGDLPVPLRAALLELGRGTALWVGGPGDPRLVRALPDAIDGDARLVVVGPTAAARSQRGALLSGELADRVDWVDLEPVAAADGFDGALVLLVLDGSRGAPAVRRWYAAFARHLLDESLVVVLDDVGGGAEVLAGEGLRLRDERGGAALLVRRGRDAGRRALP